MSERLELVKSLVVPATVIADVGCDHGMIAEYCSSLAECVIASDISEKCLQKAKTRLGGVKNVRFLCCDGIQYCCDEAIIAGMGGILISHILRTATHLPDTIIVSPHRDGALVRSTLIELGYGIDKDVPIFDRNKFYYVIRALKGSGNMQLDGLQLTYGMNCALPDGALKKRLLQLYAIYSVAPEANRARLEELSLMMSLQGMQAQDNKQ